VKPFDYYVPESLIEVFDILQQVPDAQILAGGTDLLVQAKERGRSIKALVSLRRIPGLGVLSENGVLSVGATLSAARTAADPLISRDYTALAMGAGVIGSIQIRNMATVGGNICNASPSADTAPGLLALDARAVLGSAGGERILPLEDFFLNPGKTALQPGEILVRLQIPRPPFRCGSYYLRHTPRAWMDLAFVGAAAMVELGEGGEIRSARIALGAVAPTPLRARRAEVRLSGCLPNDDLLAEAARLAAEETRPIDDLRASAEYRRHMAEVLTRRALEQALLLARG
jgi:aerobic carbon-monoxide dehydrogenase medium subunit